MHTGTAARHRPGRAVTVPRAGSVALHCDSLSVLCPARSESQTKTLSYRIEFRYPGRALPVGPGAKARMIIESNLFSGLRLPSY